MTGTIRITVDGRPVEVEASSMLLEALRGAGAELPTLCHHPSVEPSGACRLCAVEVTHPDWNGWSGLVTACLYPTEPGLQVSTRSERVRKNRRTLLELYLARCPDSPEIAALARAEGIDASAFPPREGADLCIQCGLCTRVCDGLSTAAIAPLGRGTEKTVGPRPDDVGEDCVGCLACAEVCPTGHIATRMGDGTLRIWNRDFELPLCSVVPEHCRACGACEEACPWAIPRVALRRGGEHAAVISQSTCTGCGLCAGACPTGAIVQAGFPVEVFAGRTLTGEDLRGRTVVFACARTVLPPDSDVIAVSCIGAVGIESLLACLARGADGALLMCRDRDTCPHGEGGKMGESRAELAGQLAAMTGLGKERIRYVRPAPGPAGPGRALAEFRESLTASPLAEPCDPLPDSGGLDLALALLRDLREQPELSEARRRSRADLRGDAQDEGAESSAAETVLYLGDLPELALLTRSLGAGDGLRDQMGAALRVLGEKGIAFRTVASRAELAVSGAKRAILFSHDMLPDPPADIEVTTLADLAGAPPDTDGGGVAAVTGPGFRFRIGPDERRRLVELLRSSRGALRCASPYEQLQAELLARLGAWHEARFEMPLPVCAGVGDKDGREDAR